jgi:hypothetical protein
MHGSGQSESWFHCMLVRQSSSSWAKTSCLFPKLASFSYRNTLDDSIIKVVDGGCFWCLQGCAYFSIWEEDMLNHKILEKLST